MCGGGKEGARRFHALPTYTILPAPCVFTYPEAEVPFHRHGWLSHWPLVINSVSLWPPQRLGVGLKIPTCNYGLVFLETSLHTEAIQGPPAISHFISIKRHSYYSIDFKSFRTCVPGTQGQRPNIYFIFIIVAFFSYLLTNITYFRTVKILLKDKWIVKIRAKFIARAFWCQWKYHITSLPARQLTSSLHNTNNNDNDENDNQR